MIVPRRSLQKVNHLMTVAFESFEKGVSPFTAGKKRQVNSLNLTCSMRRWIVWSRMWRRFDHGINCFLDTGDEDAEEQVLGFSWRSEPELWNNRKHVNMDSVIDSGASSPNAPPGMLLYTKISESEGSRHGQIFTSASKHKLLNLGEQRIRECTKEEDEEEVSFQVANVSTTVGLCHWSLKPRFSRLRLCDMRTWQRVTFGKSGVVVKLRSGRQIPFVRKDGIYKASLSSCKTLRRERVFTCSDEQE